MATWRWYLTIAAVRDYMQIARLSGPLEEDNSDFLRAQEDLGRASLTARLVEGKETASGAQIYRLNVQLPKVSRRILRLEFTVAPAPRTEGSLPQLVRVTAKMPGPGR